MPMKTDRELLAAWLETGDESAFAELVARHRQMVYRTSLRMLGSVQDTEDAVQAVFVVLAQKADRLQREGSLGGWLHTVTRHVAMQALARRASHARREKEFAMSPEADIETSSPDVDTSAVLRCLDQELAGLSAVLREAVVLRYLQGNSEKAAAELAGCPLGTLSWRASKGLAKLRARLAKRGVALSGAALAGLLTSEASAAVPETLLPFILATVKTAVATTATATGATTTAGMLAKGAMKAMFIAKVKMVAAVAAAVVVTGLAVPVGIAVSVSAGSSNLTVTNAPVDAVGRPETAQRMPVTSGETNSIGIKGNRCAYDARALWATYEGDVQLTTAQFSLTADRVLTFFENTNQIRRIEAFGNVVFRQPERQVTCDKAVYEKAEAKVTLTGKTVLTGTTAVTRGEDSITASELVLNLNDKKVTVSGGGKVQVLP